MSQPGPSPDETHRAARRRSAGWAVALAVLLVAGVPTAFGLLGRGGGSPPGAAPTGALSSTAPTTDEPATSHQPRVYNQDVTPVVAYGDVDRDGQTDALLVLDCLTPPGRRNPTSVLLLISWPPVGSTTPPGLRTLGFAYASKPRAPDGLGENYLTVLEVLPDGTVHYVAQTYEGLSRCSADVRWTPTGFDGECLP